MCWAGLQETRALAVYYNWKVLELAKIQARKCCKTLSWIQKTKYLFRKFLESAFRHVSLRAVCWAGLQETQAQAVYYNWKVLGLVEIQVDTSCRVDNWSV